jgi:hypothetical protein
MKPTKYKRGKYNKQYPKEIKITFLSDKLMIVNLNQLSVMKHISMSQAIREAIHEYYIRSFAGQ